MFKKFLGKKVKVTCELTGDTVKGTLTSEVVDWNCDMLGQTIYCVDGNILSDGDKVEEIT